MVRERHIFYIRSDFQYLICRGIISKERLQRDDCFFIVDRGVKLFEEDNYFPFYQKDHFPSFKERINTYFKHLRSFHSFFKRSKVVLYAPFSGGFPQCRFSEVYFYEEGFSSFAKSRKNEADNGQYKSEQQRYRFLKMLLPFASKGSKAFLLGIGAFKETPLYSTKLYITDDDSYSTVTFPEVKKTLVDLNTEMKFGYDIPRHCYVFVLDRFSTFGRPFSLDNYKLCVQNILRTIIPDSVREIWVKYHPADYGYDDANDIMKEMFQSFEGTIHYFDGKLEYLAAQNNGIRFIGSNSTILYYSSILGETNKAYSFSKMLASLDADYREFMMQWGGMDSFVSLFSKRVECL